MKVPGIVEQFVPNPVIMAGYFLGKFRSNEEKPAGEESGRFRGPGHPGLRLLRRYFVQQNAHGVGQAGSYYADRQG